MQRSVFQYTAPCTKNRTTGIKANWSAFERRPTWSLVSSVELARILGVHLQTINNWKLRGILPSPEPQKRGAGNRNWYRISKIRSWLETRSEEDIHWSWIKQNIGYSFSSLKEADQLLRSAYKILEVEKPNAPLIPTDN